MSDRFYRLIRVVYGHPFDVSGRPTLLHRERSARPGPFLLAANHHSPFDAPLLIRHSVRLLDFVSITEVFERPITGWFYGHLNAFPLDRSKRDTATMRTILDRLANGRVVAMFPEGHLRPQKGPQKGDSPLLSVTQGGPIRPGIGRLAIRAGVPILPAVVLHSDRYRHPTSWLPLKRTRYGLWWGGVIHPPPRSTPREERSAAAAMEARLCDALRAGHAELSAAMARSLG